MQAARPSQRFTQDITRAIARVLPGANVQSLEFASRTGSLEQPSGQFMDHGQFQGEAQQGAIPAPPAAAAPADIPAAPASPPGLVAAQQQQPQASMQQQAQMNTVGGLRAAAATISLPPSAAQQQPFIQSPPQQPLLGGGGSSRTSTSTSRGGEDNNLLAIDAARVWKEVDSAGKEIKAEDAILVADEKRLRGDSAVEDELKNKLEALVRVPTSGCVCSSRG